MFASTWSLDSNRRRKQSPDMQMARPLTGPGFYAEKLRHDRTQR